MTTKNPAAKKIAAKKVAAKKTGALAVSKSASNTNDRAEPPPMIVGDTPVRQDGEGRYCLNDLHRAAGGADKDRPGDWMKLKKTQDLVAQFSIGGKPPIQSKQGVGTFASEDLVIAYAMWVSVDFFAIVIKTFKATAIAQANQARSAQDPAPPEPVAPAPVVAIADKRLADLSLGIIALDLVAGSRNLKKFSEDAHLNGLHRLFRQHGLSADTLPQPTDDTFSGEETITHLLGSRGSCLSPYRFFRLLADEGLVYRFTRPSSKQVDEKAQPVMRGSWRVTTAGTHFGFDHAIAQSHGRDFTVLFYPSRFNELMRIITPRYDKLIAAGYKPRWPRSENAEHARQYMAKYSGERCAAAPPDQAEAAARAADLR